MEDDIIREERGRGRKRGWKREEGREREEEGGEGLKKTRAGEGSEDRAVRGEMNLTS
jgi:hypothetical protein